MTNKNQPFITCHLKGGLGNQLFQIFNALRNALKYNGHRIVFTNASLIDNSYRSTYWQTLLDALQKYTMSIRYSDFKTVIREKEFAYNSLDAEIFLSITTNNPNILFDGYFQSPKYFEDMYPTIYPFLQIAEKQEIVRKKLDNLNVELNNAVTVSMHFRLGDYKFLENHHPVLKKEYYVDALKYISLHSPKTITHVLYFYQNDDEDVKEVQKIISALKEQFQDIQFISIYSLSGINRLDDWEQMLAMSCCRHHIIANSTFSWWGAYLSKSSSNSNKIVCYPSIWFGPALKHHNTSDLFPEEWKNIE